jgi:RsiW-degrading membrane proteinase PrsW (M82 family)
MTSKQLPKGLLKHLSASEQGKSKVYVLGDYPQVAIGRDPRCQIVLEASLHGAISRRHAEIRPIVEFGVAIGWQVCDLDSANGTFVNGQKIRGCRDLQPGDRITLSQDGPEFQFEYESVALAIVTPEPKAVITSLTLTQLMPIMSTGKDLLREAYLLPGILTVIFVVMMFASMGNAQLFNRVLSIYLSGGAYYFVYKLCGKSKPWWLLLAAMIFTMLILRSPVLDVFIQFFRKTLPGSVPLGEVSMSTVFVSMFFGAGLMEELIKALPVLVFFLLGLGLKSPWKQRIGVLEPLDGILIGTASAVGFTLVETLGLYVPGVVQSVTLQAGNIAIGELTGLQLLIPRVLGSVAGHMAYSGYFGYFIGLSVLKPSRRWQILMVGYISASLLHAFWNTGATISPWMLVFVGGLSYAFLAAAILKARTFSPKQPKPRPINLVDDAIADEN